MSWPDIWRPVPGLPGYIVSWSGRVIGPSGKELAQSTTQGGYRRVSVGQGKFRRAVLVHRLVLAAFKGLCPDGFQSLHEDDDGENNWLGNLSYGTALQNTATRVHGNSKKTQCPQGHDYTADNTYWEHTPTGRSRRCRRCRLEGMATYYQQKKCVLA